MRHQDICSTLFAPHCLLHIDCIDDEVSNEFFYYDDGPRGRWAQGTVGPGDDGPRGRWAQGTMGRGDDGPRV